MALFAVTGLLSLGAGMGVGALLPVEPRSKKVNKKRVKLEGGQAQTLATPMEPMELSVHKRVVLPPSMRRPLTRHGSPTQGPLNQGSPTHGSPAGPYPGLLDFDEFDKSLMKMLQTEKYSTIRPSVAYDSKYYIPRSTVQQVQSQPNPGQSLANTVQSQPKPIQSQPKRFQGGHTAEQVIPKPLNTSWF
jgi:hypothetical protein